MATIASLEIDWLIAREIAERTGATDADRNGEQEAYEAYAHACHDAGICLAVGCLAKTSGVAYCDRHRA